MLSRGRATRRGRQLTGPFDDRTSFEESFKVLRSNVTVALADIANPTIVVTSANPNEGKTVTSANLAASFAAAGRRVVLVDLDFRHPNAHRVVGAHNHFGATEVLTGQRSLEVAMQYVALPGSNSSSGMYFLATGNQVENPAELLGSGRTARLLEALAGQADVVLLDTPPVLPVADTLVIGRIASGALLVTEARHTATGAVQKAKDLLVRNQTRLLGFVLNKFAERDSEYGYGYAYGYGPRRSYVGPAEQTADVDEFDSAGQGDLRDPEDDDVQGVIALGNPQKA